MEQEAGLLSGRGEDGQANSVQEGQRVNDGQVCHGEPTGTEARGQGENFQSFGVAKIWMFMFLGFIRSSRKQDERI